jgi:uncharacterized protein YbjT (DUF2867 family)
MIYREIVHTCSNSYVADAAVISIGGEIARALADGANRLAMSRGDYAAKLVRDFASRADEGERGRVTAAARGSQQPILSGLRYILERGVNVETPPAWMIAARHCPA